MYAANLINCLTFCITSKKHKLFVLKFSYQSFMFVIYTVQYTITQQQIEDTVKSLIRNSSGPEKYVPYNQSSL